MASMIKTAAVTVAMSKCPFLSNEVLAFALKSTKLYSTFARKCPVMGQLLTKVGLQVLTFIVYRLHTI